MRRIAFAITVTCLCSQQLAHGQRGRITIQWPSSAFRSFQALIDSAPNGALIEIASGDLPMTPVVIYRKTLEFAGAGSGRQPGTPVTRLIGQPPTPVLDEGGNLVLPAASITGMFNLIGATVVIRDLATQLSDAAVVIRDDADGTSGATLIQDVVIAGAGRGINVLSSGPVIVEDVAIEKPLWHGISASPLTAGSVHLTDAIIVAPLCAGAFFENAAGFFDNVTITGASCGGIVGIRGTGAFITDSYLADNRLAGILLFETPGGFIDGNTIEHTVQGSINHPALKICVGVPDCGGDGIALVLSGHIDPIFMRANTIHNTARGSVAIWGSTAALEDNTMTCAAFDVNVEIFQGVPFVVDDIAANKCGCGGALTSCVGISSNLVPPPTVPP